MRYFIEGQNVYQENGNVTGAIGSINKVETIRIDDNTVEDVAYTFDIAIGDYVENTAIPRVTRTEPLPPIPVSNEQKIARLEADNADLKSKNAEIILTLVINNLL